MIKCPEIFTDNPDPTPHSLETWALNFSTTGPVIRRIPKASRIQACKIFTDILTEVTNKNDKKSWEHLFQYPWYCLSGTAPGGKKKQG